MGTPSVFGAESLRALSFSTKTEATKTLRDAADVEGFGLRIVGGNADCIRFWCDKGDFGKGQVSTKKCGCNFHFNVRLRADGKWHPVVDSGDSLEHNHPIIRARDPLTDEIKDLIRMMYDADAPPEGIARELELKKGIQLLREDIFRIAGKAEQEPGLAMTQTDALLSQMGEDTFARILELEGKRVGIFTATATEQEHLRR